MRYVVQFLAILSVLAISQPSLGQVYFGGSVGTSEPDSQGDEAISPELDGDTGFRGFVGNQLSKTFAFEAAYVDLGSYDIAAIEGAPDTLDAEDSVSISGYEASIVGKLRLKRNFAATARLGIFAWDGERSTLPTGATESVLIKRSDRDYSIALGVEYRFMDHFGTRLEASQYKTGDVLNYLYGLGFYFTF